MTMVNQHLGLLMPHPPIIVEGVAPEDRQDASATIKACAEAAAIVAAYEPDTLILISPHGPVFRDAVAMMATPVLAGDLSRFGAHSVRISVPVDLALARSVVAEAQAESLPLIAINAENAAHYRIRPELDHGAIVPLSFLLQPDRPPYPFLHLTYGMLSGATLFRIGQAIRRAADQLGRRVAIVASGDLSHRLKASGPYGFDPAGPPLDRRIVAALSGSWAERRDDLAALFHLPEQTLEHAAECGLRSIQLLLGFLDAEPVTGRCLSYEGPFGVGYAVCVFEPAADATTPQPSLLPLIEASPAHPYVRLARQSLEHFLSSGSRLKPSSDLDPALFDIRRGCFVSIHQHGHDGELRGCIGTMQPTAPNLAQEIIANAISAGLHDPRFPPVEKSELADLHFSVDVLSELELTTRDQLDPRRFGVLVRSGGRSGVLLPDLDGVDTIADQLSIALRKGGIRPGEHYSIERFTVDRYPEPD